MQLFTGNNARSISLASLAPMIQAIGAGFGPSKRACFHTSDGVVNQLRSGKDIARFSAPDVGMMSLLPKLMNDVLSTADRDLGDGTSRLAILAFGIYREAALAVERGIEGRRIADELKKIVLQFCEEIDRSGNRAPCLNSVGLTAGVNADVAKTIADMTNAIGPEGIIEVVSGDDGRVSSHIENGFSLEAIPVLPSMQVMTLSSVHVLVANEIIDDFGGLVKILELFATHGKALLIIARDVTGTALQTLAANRGVANLRVSAFKPTDVGMEAAEVLRDIAVATGAQLICTDEGTNLSALRPTMLGTAAEFRYADGRLILPKPGGDIDEVESRCRMLRARALRKQYLSLDRERLERRAARLGGRYGELRIGSGYEDIDVVKAGARRASASVLSAAKGGTIMGGTKGLARIAQNLAVPETEAATMAKRSLLAGIQALDDQLAVNRHHESGRVRDPFKAILELASSPIDPTIQDPCLLTSQILSRAASAAAAFISSGALLSR